MGVIDFWLALTFRDVTQFLERKAFFWGILHLYLRVISGGEIRCE